MSKLSSNTVKIVWQFARINALPPTRKCDVYVNNNSCSNLLWWDFNRMSSKLNYIIEQTDDENSAALYVFKVSVLLWNSVFYMRIHKNKIHYDNITHYWILDFFKICGFLVHKIQFHHKTNKNPLNRLKRVSIYEYIYIYIIVPIFISTRVIVYTILHYDLLEKRHYHIVLVLLILYIPTIIYDVFKR